MKPGCDVCLSVCLSVIGMRGMRDKHPSGARCNLGFTGRGTTGIRSNGLDRRKQTHRRLPVNLYLVYINFMSTGCID